jgi:hypothetical protein
MVPAVPARRLRAAALAGASFTLGLLGHRQAGGHSLTTGALVFAAGFCVLSGLAYSRRRLSGPAVAAILLGNQVVVHVGLALGAGSAHAGHASSAASAGSGLLPSGGMILAHLVATTLTAAAIVLVEASYLACVALLTWFLRAVRLVPRGVLAVRRLSCPTAYRAPLWHSRPVGSVPGRGPPRLVPVV